jgi:hypothetical protein
LSPQRQLGTDQSSRRTPTPSSTGHPKSRAYKKVAVIDRGSEDQPCVAAFVDSDAFYESPCTRHYKRTGRVNIGWIGTSVSA